MDNETSTMLDDKIPLYDFLEGFGLAIYYETFIENGWNKFSYLVTMTESNLQDMQVKPGHVKTILDKIKFFTAHYKQNNPVGSAASGKKTVAVSNSDDDYDNESQTDNGARDLFRGEDGLTRRGTFHQPKTGEYEVKIAVVIADGGQAVHNAVRDVFGEDVIIQKNGLFPFEEGNEQPSGTSTFCSRHVNGGNIDRHKNLLTHKKNKAIINFDFWFGKNVNSLLLAPLVWNIMLDKWSVILQEKDFVEAYNWSQGGTTNVWNSRSWLRILNCHLVGVTGIPNDNNTGERHHHTIRTELQHKLFNPITTFQNIAAQCHTDSIRDTDMSERPGKAICTRKFYDKVETNKARSVPWFTCPVLVNM